MTTVCQRVARCSILLLCFAFGGSSSAESHSSELLLPEITEIKQLIEQLNPSCEKAETSSPTPPAMPAEAAADVMGRIESSIKLGDAHLDRRDYEEALVEYNKGLALTDEQQCHVEEQKCRVNRIRILTQRALAQRHLGRYRLARESLEESERLSASHPAYPEWRIIGLAGIASLDELRGRYADALRGYTKALDMLQKSKVQNDELATQLQTDIATVNAELGRDSESETGFQAVRNTLLNLSKSTEIGEQLKGRVLHNYGYALLKANRNQEAIEQFKDALPYRIRACNLRGVAKTLNNLGFALTELGRCESAMPYLDLALSLNHETGDRPAEASTSDSIGKTQLCLGNTDSALENLQMALALNQDDDIDDLGAQHQVLSHIAEVYKELGNRGLEIVYLKRAVHVIETIRAELGTLPIDVRSSFDKSVELTYRRLRDALLSTGRLDEARQVGELVHLEQTDAYLQGLSSPGTDRERHQDTEQMSDADVGPPFNSAEKKIWDAQQELLLYAADTAARERRLGARIDSLKCGQSENRDPAECNRAEQEWQHAAGELGKVRSDFSNFISRPDVEQALNAKPELIKLDNLQGVTDNVPDAALIYPILLADQLVVIVTAKNLPPIAYTRDNLSTQSVLEAIKVFRRDLQSRWSDPRPGAKRFYNWLIGEEIRAVLDLHDIHTIIYVPDGQLRYIPLAALYDGKNWLVENFAVTTITVKSLERLGRTRSDFTRVLAAASTQAHSIPSGEGPAVVLDPLPGARSEISDLAKRYRGRVDTLLDEDFSSTDVPQTFGLYQVIHLATHAKFTPGKHRDESFIVFGDGKAVTFSDIDGGGSERKKAWRLNGVELFVLSACETGVGGVVASDGTADGREILGFGFRMEKAGAKSVVASLWKVSDDGTPALMDEFYAALQQGKSRAEALRQAQRKLIAGCVDGDCLGSRPTLQRAAVVDDPGASSGEEAKDLSGYRHPYFWAPFFLIGAES